MPYRPCFVCAEMTNVSFSYKGTTPRCSRCIDRDLINPIVYTTRKCKVCSVEFKGKDENDTKCQIHIGWKRIHCICGTPIWSDHKRCGLCLRVGKLGPDVVRDDVVIEITFTCETYTTRSVYGVCSTWLSEGWVEKFDDDDYCEACYDKISVTTK